jgi:CubicO group peptidase (beta-lactamase class C family)
MLLGISAVLSVQAQTLEPAEFAPISARVQSMLDDTSVQGAVLMIARDNEVLYRKAFGNYSLNQRVAMASASKWLSGAVIARLVDRGTLRFDDNIGRYLPSAPQDKRAITVRQLFSHTSGLSGGEASCIGSANIAMQSCVDQILAQPLLYAPGTRFAYGGNSMHVAGRLAEIATGKTWDQLFREEVAEPLAMTQTDYAFSSTAPGYVEVSNPRIAGGARSTAADYLKLTQAYLARGMVNGRTWLSAAMIDILSEDQSRGAPVLSTPFPEANGYGIGLWLEQRDAAGRALVLSSPGAFGSYPMFDRKSGFAAILLTQNILRNVEDTAQSAWLEVANILKTATPKVSVIDGYVVPASATLPHELFAQAPGSGRVFLRWRGDSPVLSDPRAWHQHVAVSSRDVALSAEFLSVPGSLSPSTQSINGARYRQLVPSNPRGLIFSFHGSGGSGDLPFQKVQALENTRLYLARGFGIIGLDSVNRSDRQWNPQFSLSNPDVLNVQGIIERLRQAGNIQANTPLFCEGTSNGGGFCSRVSALLGFQGQSLMIADGIENIVQQASVPTIWTLGRRDPTLASDYLQRAQSSAKILSDRGILNELNVVEPSPVYPERFARIEGIALSDSIALTESLRLAGFLDTRGMVIRDPRGGAIDAVIPTALRSLRGDISGQMENAMAGHEYYSDTQHRVVHFFEAQLKRNLTGLYFKADESGWGLSIAHQGNQLFPTWYTYDQNGRAIWYSGAVLSEQADGSFKGPTFRVTGTPFAQIGGEGSAVASAVGELSIRAQSAGALDFGYTIEGLSQSKRMQPFRFGRLPACRFGSVERSAAANRSDIWFNPRQPGWGLSISEQDQTIVLAWYTYAEDGAPLWFLGTLTRDAEGRFTGPLFRPQKGTPFAQINGTPASGNLPQVGDATLEFIDGSRGSFRYRMGAVMQTRDIERFVFGSQNFSECQ